MGVNWPTVFEADSCKPDFSTLDIDADTDFNLNLKDFDPFPSVSGVHDGGDGDDEPRGHDEELLGSNAVSGDNLLNLTLNNETTGASCTITTLDATHLNCTLSGGTRSGDTANNNKWKDGDEYAVEGNVLALLGIILDNLDELVEQVDADRAGRDRQGDPADRDLDEGARREDPVGQADARRPARLAARDGRLHAQRRRDEHRPRQRSAGRSTSRSCPTTSSIYCRAVSTVEPDAVTWTAKALGTDGDLVVGNAVNSLGGMAANGMLDTVGPSPTARVEITLSDQNGAGRPTTR